MNKYLYRDNLNAALDRSDVEELIVFWRQSVYLGKEGRKTQEAIRNNLPKLAVKYGVTLPAEPTFRLFVEEYDEKMYAEQCTKEPIKCVKKFAEEGNRPLLRIARKRIRQLYVEEWQEHVNTFDLEIALLYAARVGNSDLALDLVDELIVKKGTFGFSLDSLWSAYAAARNGQLETALLLIGKIKEVFPDRDTRKNEIEVFMLSGDLERLKKAIDEYDGFTQNLKSLASEVVTKRDKKVLDYFLRKGVIPSEEVVFDVLEKNDLEMLEMFDRYDVLRQVKFSDKGLKKAVASGDLKLTQFLLDLGVYVSPKSMEIAAKNNDREMIKLLLKYSSDPDVYNHGRKGADEGGHVGLRRFFSRRLAGLPAEL